MSLRLFKVVDATKEAHFFAHKSMAKAFVEKLRETNPDMAYPIMRGPDHNRGESFNVSKQTPKSRKNRNG